MTKNLEDFVKDRKQLDGRKGQCKACIASRRRRQGGLAKQEREAKLAEEAKERQRALDKAARSSQEMLSRMTPFEIKARQRASEWSN